VTELSEIRPILVHDWLTGMRGGEKCLELVCRRFPSAPLFTLLHRKGSVSPIIEQRSIRHSFLQRFPGVSRYYRYLLPMMPMAVGWRIPECDLVVSFSHCVAKGVQPPNGVPHVSYCFTPMRYAWHMKNAYFGQERIRRSGIGRLKAFAVDSLLSRIRNWDLRTASRVTHFIAISRTIQHRIRECYDRDSVVIYPPVDTEFYTPAAVPREDFYLVVSAFAPYKRIDLAMDACRKLGRRLVIIGSGQDTKRLQMLSGSKIEFLGWQSDEVIRDHMRRCRALLFPGEEDFGIVPVEAQACGAPVIAFGRGGATETIVDGVTGTFFEEQSVDSLAEAMESFERESYDPLAARRNAELFESGRYERELFAYLGAVVNRNESMPERRAA